MLPGLPNHMTDCADEGLWAFCSAQRDQEVFRKNRRRLRESISQFSQVIHFDVRA